MIIHHRHFKIYTLKMRRTVFIAILYVCAASLSKASTDEEILSNIPFKRDDANINMTIIEKWQNFEKIIKYSTNNAVKRILPFLMESAANLNISTECMRNSMHLINGLKHIKSWALRFLDSSGKIIDGMMVGTMSNFGLYDECLDTEVRSMKLRDKGKILYRGQYCSIDMKPPLPPKKRFYKLEEISPELKNFTERDTIIADLSKSAHFFNFLKLRLGICVPSGCSVKDIDKIAKMIGESLYLEGSTTLCELKKDSHFTPILIFVIFAFSFAGFLMLIGSLIDIYAYYKKILFKSKLIRVLVAFSLFTNFRKFSNTKTASDTLSCLNGIRFLCMSWIILGHTYLLINYQMILGLIDIQQYAKDFAFQAVQNSSVAVDTFFCIGGLLVSYLTAKLVLIQGRKFNLGFYVLHRLWRLLPSYIYVILFMLILDEIGSGPIWHETTDKPIRACYDNWWANLLFINNFYGAEHMCVRHSWYIASDFQLYIGSLIIILPMIRWPRIGIILSVFTIIASIVYSGLGTYIYNYPPAMLFVHPDPDQRESYWARFYFRPFIHASPYCIGFLAGYIIATKPKLKIPPSIQAIGWCIAFICNFSVLYGVFEWNKGRDPTFVESILYSSLSRTAWTLGVAWMIVCCATGHGGIINYILSWKAFVPLGRLTYIAFLIHPIIQIVIAGSARTNIQPQHFFAVWIYFGHMFVTYSTAFAGSMLIESPFMALEKIIFPSQDKKTENNNTNVKQNSFINKSRTKEGNSDIADIIHKIDEESGGIDNSRFVYKL